MHLVNVLTGPRVPSLTDPIMFGQVFSTAFGRTHLQVSHRRQERRIAGSSRREVADSLSSVSPPKSIPPARTPPWHVGISGLVAATVIGLQALGCAVFAVLFLPAATKGASLSDTSHVMFSMFTALFAVGLGVVARGLWQGLSWPRTATVVWLVLLLPLGWAMVQAGRWLVGVLILGSAVVGIGAVAAESRNASRP
jgi:hypothetical protein